jgi:tRNA(Ile2) C34 agmatinyltransferase TiaS
MDVKIKDVPAKAVMQKAYCPECMVELKMTGRVTTVQPPNYEFKCPKCDDTTFLDKTYPAITFKPDEKKIIT